MPRRTIGRLCCPIARTLGVRYSHRRSRSRGVGDGCPAGRVRSRPRRATDRERGEWVGAPATHVWRGETAKRPGRQAGVRYSAGRAPGGCGRFILSELEAITGLAGAVARTRTRDGRPSGRRSRGKHPTSRPSVRSPRTGTHTDSGEGNKTNNNRTTPVGAKIGNARRWIIEIFE